MKFKGIEIKEKLIHQKIKLSKPDEAVIDEVYKILNNDLLHEKKILNNLKYYQKSFSKIDEEDISDKNLIFKSTEIKALCIKYRLKFLESKHFKPELPYESVLKIRELNKTHHKDLKEFKILSHPNSFKKTETNENSLLFVPTNHGNYYLIHHWGPPLKWHRKFTSLPLRSFESIFITVAIISAIIAFSLPTRLIWLPQGADWWGGYRFGALFHIFIFNMGITAYITFAFSKNFSSSNWNSYEDFG